MGYGQYSALGGRRRTMHDARVMFPEAAKITRGTGHNAFHVVLKTGAQIYRLHDTDLVTVNASGTRMVLDNGGWITPTTHAHLYEGLRVCTGADAGWSSVVYADRGQTRVRGVRFGRWSEWALRPVTQQWECIGRGDFEAFWSGGGSPARLPGWLSA